MFAEFSEGKQTFTVDQFHTICEKIGEHFTRQEIEAMIQAADANQDGVIDYQEFLDVVTKEYKKWSSKTINYQTKYLQNSKSINKIFNYKVY